MIANAGCRVTALSGTASAPPPGILAAAPDSPEDFMATDAPTDAAEASAAEGPSTDTLAAVDLGSNSFHLLVARMDGGTLQVIDQNHGLSRPAVYDWALRRS